jgi:hypothetical protein
MARRTTASVVLVVLKAAGLTAVNLILWAAVTTAGARLFGVEPLLDLAAPSADSLACALAASAAHAAVLSWLAVRSGWRGVKLLAALGGVYFGMNAVLPRLAGLCWDSDVTGALTRALLDSGAAAVSSGAFAVLAAALFRKLAGSLESGVVKGRLVMPFWELLGKVTFLAGVVFPLLYFAFRYHLSFGYEDGVFVRGEDLVRALRAPRALRLAGGAGARLARARRAGDQDVRLRLGRDGPPRGRPLRGAPELPAHGGRALARRADGGVRLRGAHEPRDGPRRRVAPQQAPQVPRRPLLAARPGEEEEGLAPCGAVASGERRLAPRPGPLCMTMPMGPAARRRRVSR